MKWFEKSTKHYFRRVIRDHELKPEGGLLLADELARNASARRMTTYIQTVLHGRATLSRA